MLSVIRSIQEAFGDPRIPKDGPGFRKVKIARRQPPGDVRKAYQAYLSTGGTPIAALDSIVNQTKLD
jgi:hypothetical protein